MPAPGLFEPVSFRSVTARNRIALAPMCQYSADTAGYGNDWHIQHLGARAMGGAGIVMTEATAVDDIGRITHNCLGLWNDEHTALLKRMADVITLGGAVPAIQIAHAGRKASCARPHEGGAPIPPEHGGWRTVAPSPIPFNPDGLEPIQLTTNMIAGIASQFAATAKRALEAGFKIVELHSAHGYLSHSFLSPISNKRNDGYGGDLHGRARFLMETIDAVRAVWPAELPLFVRLSCSDYKEGGLTIDNIVSLCRMLAHRGDVDLIDCSSGGITPDVRPPSLHPGYQVPFAEAVKQGANIATGAVGLIQEPQHAAEIVANRRADLVFLGRVMLADPAWPLRAAKALGAKTEMPTPYLRALMH